jgi:hypothetical protein
MHLNKTTEVAEIFLILKRLLFSNNSLCPLVIYYEYNQTQHLYKRVHRAKW